MAITVEARTSIIELVVGMFGAAPGASILSDLVAAYEAGQSLKQIAANLANTNEFKGIFPTFLTNAEFATKVVNQLVGSEVVQAEKDAAVTTLTGLLNGGQSRSSVFVDAINAVNAITSTNTAWANAGAAFDNKVSVAVYYSVDKQLSGSSLSVLQNIIGNVTSTASTVATAKSNVDGTSSTGKTFTLTTSVDNGDSFKGGSSDDSFNALIDGTTAANTTLSAADVFSGGNGNDTLNITFQGGPVAGIPAADITGIETVNVRVVGTGALTAVDLSAIPGVTSFNADRSTQDVTLTKLASGGAIGMIGNGVTQNASINYAYATATAAQTINLSGGTSNAGTANITATASTGVTTATINSTGASNSVDTIKLDSAGGGTVTSLTVNATTNLTATLTAADYAATSALKVSGAATEVSLTTPGNFKTIDASGLTAGGLTIALGTNLTSFKGGAGNDVVTTAAVTTTVADSVDAGAGTADRLIVGAGTDVDTAAEAKVYKGFDQLQVAGATVDVSLFTNSTITSLRASGVTTLNKITATQAGAITVTASSTLTANVIDATTVGQLDSITIDVNDGAAAVGAVGALVLTTPTFAGVETINLKATDGFTVGALTGTTALTNLVVTGAGETSVTTGALALNVNTVFDFSGATGAVTFSAAAATTNAFSVKGGSGVDTVTDSAIGGSSIVTGAGKDAITLTAKTGGTAGNVITAGAAADIITVTTAKGNDAQDVLTFKFAAGDSIIDNTAATGNANTGYSTAVTDQITGIDFTASAAAAAGHVITLDTTESATAVTFSATKATFGTTTVTNAYDFYVFADAATGDAYVYQDTNGDKIISNGEFGIKLTGTVASAGWATGEFAVTSGNLVITTAA